MSSKAVENYLAGDSNVVALVRAYNDGSADWPTTAAALKAVKYADVPRATADQLMGRDGGEYVADNEIPGDPVPGSWGEVKRAENYGLLTSDEVMEVLKDGMPA